jgi:hypothetical protein
MGKLIKQEPVLFQGFVQASFGVAVSFGLHLTTGQIAALLALTAAILSLITRRYVTPLGK